MYIKKRNDVKDTIGQVCQLEEADFILFEIVEGLQGVGNKYLFLEKQAVYVSCVYYNSNNVTAMYIHREMYLNNISEDVKLRLSKVMYGHDLFSYGLISTPRVAQGILHIKDVRYEKFLEIYNIDENICKYNSQFEQDENEINSMLEVITPIIDGTRKLRVDRVSAYHLRHITVKELARYGTRDIAIKTYKNKNLIKNVLKFDLTETFFCGLLIWLMLLPPKQADMFCLSDVNTWLYNNEEDFFLKIKKYFTLKLKAVQNLISIDLTPFFEMEVLVNRGMGNISWEEEEEHRTKPNVCTIPAVDIYKYSLELFSDIRMTGSKPRNKKWSDFWESRWEWAPTGVYHTQYDEDNKYLDEEKECRNKLNALSRMEEKDVIHFLDRAPSMVAWPSIKYEWGKQRSIYGVDITNFILSAFAFSDCEDVLAAKFPIGKAATEGNVRNTVKEVLRNGIPFCFDFEDFNSQHSTVNMQMVLEAYLYIFKADMSDDQIKSVKWVMQALGNVRILDIHDRNRSYEAAGTLLSGWRLTTFMNTVLNYVYTKISMGSNDNMVSTHNGDDVLAGVLNLNELLDFLNNSKRNNIRYQRNKCYLGAIAEFLRVDHLKGVGAQYLARAVSTFVHGATETSIPNDIRSTLEALNTRRIELIQRGSDERLVNRLLYSQLQHLENISTLNSREMVRVINTHYSNGGLSKYCTQQSLRYSVTPKFKEKSEVRKKTRDIVKEFPGVAAYTKRLVRQGVSAVYAKKIIKQLYLTTQVGISTTLVDYRVNEVHDPGGTLVNLQTLEENDAVQNNLSNFSNDFDNIRWLNASQYGMFRNSYHGRKAVLAKTFGIPLLDIKGKDTEISDRLKREQNSYAAARILL